MGEMPGSSPFLPPGHPRPPIHLRIEFQEMTPAAIEAPNRLMLQHSFRHHLAVVAVAVAVVVAVVVAVAVEMLIDLNGRRGRQEQKKGKERKEGEKE